MRRFPLPGASAFAAGCIVVALALAVGDSRGAGPAAQVVTIDAFALRPPVVTVKQGQTIEWRNTDPVPHTATAKDAGLDSGEIAPNGTFRFTAKKKGHFNYICTLHPIMKGELVVE
jgi:plastocyanin